MSILWNKNIKTYCYFYDKSLQALSHESKGLDMLSLQVKKCLVSRHLLVVFHACTQSYHSHWHLTINNQLIRFTKHAYSISYFILSVLLKTENYASNNETFKFRTVINIYVVII